MCVRVCKGGWEVSCPNQKQNKKQETESGNRRQRERRENQIEASSTVGHGGAMSHQFLLASVNRSDLI